jgi:hypothetical protein
MSRRLPRAFDELRGLRSRGLVRESTEAQGDNSGPMVQQREERAFAGKWGLLAPDLFYVDFRSGSDARKRRQFLAMAVCARFVVRASLGDGEATDPGTGTCPTAGPGRRWP